MSVIRRAIGLTLALSFLSACTSFEHLPPMKVASNAQPTAVDQEPVDPPPPPLVCDRVIDDFSQVPLGAFPEGWTTPDGDDLAPARESESFRVVEADGQHVLHARYVGKAFTLGHGVPDWDLQRYPIVSWRWRALRLPRPDANLEFDEDAAASVQAVWLIGLPFFVRTMRFTWSSTLAAGSRAQARLGHDQLVVLRSGMRGEGGWHTEYVNLLANYQSFYGLEDSTAPTGIALLTDADDTASQAEAYYADFRLCRPPDAATPVPAPTTAPPAAP